MTILYAKFIKAQNLTNICLCNVGLIHHVNMILVSNFDRYRNNIENASNRHFFGKFESEE